MDYNIPLSRETIRMLKTLEVNDPQLIAGLAEEILDDRRILLNALDAYRQDKDRGAIADDSIALVDEGVTLMENLKGTLCFEFDESAYYGCRDMNHTYNNIEDLNFSIDLVRRVLVLHAMDLPVRDDEEF